MKASIVFQTRTSTFAVSAPLLTWSRNSDHSRSTTLAPNGSINRYYDPTTESFISVDPDFQMTDQAYVFTNDDPLNVTDPLGLAGWYCIDGVSHYYSGNQHGVADGKCKTKPAPAPPSTAKPPTSTTMTGTTTTLPTKPSTTQTNGSSSTVSATQVVNQYISDTSKPWCYAAAGIGAAGAFGSMDIGAITGAVEAPPSWVLALSGAITVFTMYWAIRLVAEC